MDSSKTAQGKAVEVAPKKASQGIHSRLKAARELLKLSQRAMAKQLGIGIVSWQQYEYGKTLPGAKVLAALQQEGFNATWLLTGEEPIRRAPGLAAILKATFPDTVWVLIGDEPVRLPRASAEALRDRREAHLLGDVKAAHRPKIRTESSMARLQAAHEGLEAAQNTVGYQPPVLLQEAIRVLMYSHGLDREGAVILVDFMKRQAELDKAKGED